MSTPLGTVMIREATLIDATRFRELRLNALQECPAAFPADYTVNVNHPISFWEDRLKKDETGTIFFAGHDNQMIGMRGS